MVNRAGGAAGTAENTLGGVGSATSPGGNLSGSLTSSSHGVMGMEGVNLGSTAANSAMLTSSTSNVHLDSGTQMILKVVR